jgi:hypothetical protein
MVILTDKHHGEIPQGSHVQTFVERSLIGGPIAKEAQRDPRFGPYRERQCRPDSNGNTGTHDAIGANVPQRLVGYMETATTATTGSGYSSGKLSHSGINTSAKR